MQQALCNTISTYFLRASAIETDVTVTVSHPPNRIGKFYVALMKTAARSAAKKLRTTNKNSEYFTYNL